MTPADALGEVSRMPLAKPRCLRVAGNSGMPVVKQYEQTRQNTSGETKVMECNEAGGETKEVSVLKRECLCECRNAGGETKAMAVPKRTERT